MLLFISSHKLRGRRTTRKINYLEAPISGVENSWVTTSLQVWEARGDLYFRPLLLRSPNGILGALRSAACGYRLSLTPSKYPSAIEFSISSLSWKFFHDLLFPTHFNCKFTTPSVKHMVCLNNKCDWANFALNFNSYKHHSNEWHKFSRPVGNMSRPLRRGP